jgi:galactokinase
VPDRVSLASPSVRKLAPTTEELTKQYARPFGGRPTWLASAAGRVNLLGEHTDYNHGFVLPMAIDRRLRIALGPRDDRRVVLASLDFPGIVELDLDATGPNPGGRSVATSPHEWHQFLSSELPSQEPPSMQVAQ